LPATTLALQPGLRYLAASWPVDDLLDLFLSESAPDRYEFLPQDVYLEIHGRRGAFDINRLGAGAFAFRRSLAAGETVGAAAAQAIETEPQFEPRSALAALLAVGLVVAAHPPGERDVR
jgi:hypothetical protein